MYQGNPGGFIRGNNQRQPQRQFWDGQGNMAAGQTQSGRFPMGAGQSGQFAMGFGQTQGGQFPMGAGQSGHFSMGQTQGGQVSMGAGQSDNLQPNYRHVRHGRRDRGRNRRGGGSQQEDGVQPTTENRQRHPPGLKGKEIGLWYARRNQAKNEEQEKHNRPTVHMDVKKQRNIENLLHNLKREEQSKGATASSSSSSSASSSVLPGSARGNWQPPVSLSQEWKDKFTSQTSSSDFKKPLPGQPYASSATSNFVYQSSDTQDDEPPESWEQHDDSSDMESEREASSSSLSEPFPVEVTKPTEDGFEEEEEEDDDDTVRPNVSGVVQFMRSDADYLYGDGKDDPEVSDVTVQSDNPLLDREIQEKMKSLQNNPNFVKMLQFRQKLPSYEMRQTIVDAVNSNQVLVISGETGCGKTTQVPQFILDDHIERGIGSSCRIICTQPRRISAISVAERVAAERCDNVNKKGQSSVGYQIRLETKRPRPQGSILFCTTGIVLKMLEGDPQLNRATHVIIDEIHERDLQSDFLMIILKDLIAKRKDLKILLMSATLNAEMFSRYFGNCPMLNIPGYTFPVKEYLLEEILELTSYIAIHSAEGVQRRGRRGRKPEEIEMEENYRVWCRNQQGRYNNKTLDILRNFDFSVINIELINHIINYICTAMEDGAILVFVPGWEEIKKLNEMIQKSPRFKSGSLRVIPLHSLMPTVNQREVFDRPPPGIRKIVVATNIAETSITIDDVVFVIDGGKIKVKDFDPERNLTSLEAKWVSKANAKQRRGRAGRVQPGYCFHLYTEFHYQVAEDYLPPEMLRTRLEELCLQIKLLKLGRIVPFIGKAMQHPSMEAVSHAVETLIELSALDADENLLPLGYHLARMPMEPHTGKMILFGAMFSCLDPILTVAASLSFKDAFVVPLGKEILADKARKTLAMGSKSDHIMLINAFNGWENSMKSGENRTYCWDNFLSENTLQLLKDMKKQLTDLLHDIGFVSSKNPKDAGVNQNSDNQSMIRAVLCAGLYPNVAQVVKVPKKEHLGVRMNLKDHSKVYPHPKSVNRHQTFFESKWMVFYHKLKTSQVYLHDCTMVSPYPLLFFGGDVKIHTEDGNEVVSVDNWVVFRASASIAKLVKDLRSQLDRVLTNKITRPGPTVWDKSDTEGAVMTAIADLITTEILGTGQKGDGSVGITQHHWS